MNTIEDKATARPWTVNSTGLISGKGWNEDTGYLASVSILHKDCLDNKSINQSKVESLANAKLIVKAVNLHDELIEACEYALNFIKWNDCQEFKEYGSLKSDLKEVLTKAQS